MNLPSIEALTEIIVSSGRETLLPLFNRSKTMVKSDGSVVTEADLACHRAITQRLSDDWPDISMLSEESDSETLAKLLAAPDKAMWCLDPLDGSSNFAAGFPFFSISLALIINYRVVRGLVYDPVRDECFAAQLGGGAFLNGESLRCDMAPKRLAETIALVDFKRLEPPLAKRLVVSQPFRSQRSLGSVALDWCWLAANRSQIYLHGKQKVWDFAAGSLILSEANGYSSTLEGEEVFNRDLSARSVVAAVEENLFKEWWDYCQISENP